MSDPIIPEVEVRAPTRIRAGGDMCSVVFPKRIAVEVIVVKPVNFKLKKKSIHKGFIETNFANHQKEGTKQLDT